MSQPEMLNEHAAPADLDPIELSQRLVTVALEVRRTGECGDLEPLVEALRHVDPSRIEGQHARLAFWLNVFNALLLHCLCRRPLRGNLLRHLRLFDGWRTTSAATHTP
jgi:hypothetical protein